MTPVLREEVQKVLDRQGTSDLAFESIACKLLAELDAEAAVVYTLDAGTGLLKLRCHCGLSREVAGDIRFLRVGKGWIGRAASLREPVQGLRHPQSGCPEEHEALPEASLFVPMLSDGTLRGVLGIANNFHREYAPDETASLTALARLIASYLK